MRSVVVLFTLIGLLYVLGGRGNVLAVLCGWGSWLGPRGLVGLCAVFLKIALRMVPFFYKSRVVGICDFGNVVIERVIVAAKSARLAGLKITKHFRGRKSFLS
jgi:hypothetical protein